MHAEFYSVFFAFLSLKYFCVFVKPTHLCHTTCHQQRPLKIWAYKAHGTVKSKMPDGNSHTSHGVIVHCYLRLLKCNMYQQMLVMLVTSAIEINMVKFTASLPIFFPFESVFVIKQLMLRIKLVGFEGSSCHLQNWLRADSASNCAPKIWAFQPQQQTKGP